MGSLLKGPEANEQTYGGHLRPAYAHASEQTTDEISD
jgi:hypothetical protein